MLLAPAPAPARQAAVWRRPPTPPRLGWLHWQRTPVQQQPARRVTLATAARAAARAARALAL
jgi:hypothetical protein